jgi:hypothetical protein
MKTCVFSAIVIGIALSGSAWAEDAADPAAVDPPASEPAAAASAAADPAALGRIDAMLATCREANPAGKAAYDTMRKAMVGEQQAGALAATVQTPEYRQAFDSARQQAAAESKESAVTGCVQLAAILDPQAHRSTKTPKGAAGKKHAASGRSPVSAKGAAAGAKSGQGTPNGGGN